MEMKGGRDEMRENAFMMPSTEQMLPPLSPFPEKAVPSLTRISTRQISFEDILNYE